MQRHHSTKPGSRADRDRGDHPREHTLKMGLCSILALVNYLVCLFLFAYSIKKKKLFSGSRLNLLKSYNFCTVEVSNFHDSHCVWICVC